MGSKKKSVPATYPAHRERQRRRILDAAEKLFVERGIDRVKMAELTVASGVQASTMYHYFSNKDDIVWALVGDIMTTVSARASEESSNAQTAWGKISAFLEFMADELSAQRPRVRFMAQFDAMYSHDWPVERLLKLEEESKMGSAGLRDLVGAGIADGSLRSDLDSHLTMQAIINAAVGTQRRLAALGNKVETEYGQSVDRLFRETIRIILLGLQAPGPPSKESFSGVKPRKAISRQKKK